jgi:hypothetical protein
LAAVEKGRMLATGKNSLDFHFTVCVFRKLPAFDFPLIKEKKVTLILHKTDLTHLTQIYVHHGHKVVSLIHQRDISRIPHNIALDKDVFQGR